MKRKWLLMTEEAPSGEGITTVEVLEVRRKCTLQPVLTAARKLKYLSGLTLTDQFTAESVFQTTGDPEKTVINIELIRKISLGRLRSFCLHERSNGLLFYVQVFLLNF